VRLPRVAPALALVLLPQLVLAQIVLAGCSDDTDGGAAGDTTTAPTTMARLGTSLPAQPGIVEDLVVVRRDGLHSVDGTVLVAFTEPERACIDAGADDVPELAATQPGDLADEVGLEQTLAEIVVGCVEIGRVGPVVVEQLVPQLALEGVDRTCVEDEVVTLGDQPGELAAVLAGDPAGVAAMAGVIAENCSS
jgi:hypothetical protein